MGGQILVPTIIFLTFSVTIFFISKHTTNELFHFFRSFVEDDKTVFFIVSMIFFPGTILHELSHLLAAGILRLRVHSIKIFPERQGNQIKLGSVLYEKKDFVRGVIVGVAPFFAGILFFWIMSSFDLFPNRILWLNPILAYLFFAVSSTMFSSKKDLVDILFIIPLVVIIGGFIYIFDIRLDWIFSNNTLFFYLANFLKAVNLYLFFSLLINLAIVLGLKSVRRLINAY